MIIVIDIQETKKVSLCEIVANLIKTVNMVIHLFCISTFK